MARFEDLGVRPPILEALDAMGYQAPTSVQEQGIPPMLAGKDVILEAQTGSGKTATYGIPAVVTGSASPGLRVLVLVPTRELARQVERDVRAIGAGSPFRAVAVTGGVGAEKEERTLGGDVRCIIATPGRLLAVIEARRVRLDRVALVVLDEADRMLDMGFQTDVEKVLELTAHRQQTLLLSATLPGDVLRLARKHLRDPVDVRATPERLPTSLSHHRLNVFGDRKDPALVALLRAENPERAIVFVRTRERAATIAKLLKKEGFAADPLQGDMSHDQRRHVFDLFAKGITRILVATDIASRGLDVPEMQLVINHDLPDERGAYTHRAGRAARMGRPGKVVSLVLPDEKDDRIRLEEETGAAWTPYKLDIPDAPEPPARPPPRAPRGAGPGKPRGKTPRADEKPRTPRVPKPKKQPEPDVPPSRKDRKRA